MKNRPPSKFIGFFKFMDAMKFEGCPVCRRTIEETRHSMKSFLYESVNDPGLREEIRGNGGFCHRHSWELARFGDALGSAILFRDVLGAALPSLGGARPASFFHKSPSARAEGRKCVFCRLEREFHAGLMSDLVAHIDDAEMKAVWDGPAVLCIPHLNNLCSLVRDADARRQIVELHRGKYAAMCDAMGQLIQKQSYDHRSEEIGPEKTSWLRAIEALVGMADI